MNYSIRMLQLIVGLCLGLVSVVTWAASYNDDLIEKAWSCDPVRQKMDDYSLGHLSATGLGLLIHFEGCSPNDTSIFNDEYNLMREALLQKYFVFRLGQKDGSEERLGTYEQYKSNVRGQKVLGVEYKLFDKEKERRDQSEKDRHRRVKSGAAPVKNFQDAVLLHTPTSDLTALMASPLLRPDRSIHSGRVALDAEEDDDLLRAKIDSSRFGGGVYYAHLLLTGKTVNFSPRSMRIGGVVNVIGRYVQNRKYTTIAGEEKTMPVFEVMYIGD